MVPSGFIFQRKFFNLIILISLINSSYSYLSFRYPYAIKLNNKNIFVIHELGVTICDKTFTESIDRVITFSESEQINTDAALSKVTSVITSSYVICLINNKIYIFNEEGYFLKKSDFKITSYNVEYYTLVYAGEDSSNYIYFIIGFIYNKNLYLNSYKYQTVEKSIIIQTQLAGANDYDSSYIIYNGLSCHLMYYCTSYSSSWWSTSCNEYKSVITCLYYINNNGIAFNYFDITTTSLKKSTLLTSTYKSSQNIKYIKATLLPDKERLLIGWLNTSGVPYYWMYDINGNLDDYSIHYFQQSYCKFIPHGFIINYYPEKRGIIYTCLFSSNDWAPPGATILVESLNENYQQTNYTYKYVDCQLNGYSIVYLDSKTNYYIISDADCSSKLWPFNLLFGELKEEEVTVHTEYVKEEVPIIEEEKEEEKEIIPEEENIEEFRKEEENIIDILEEEKQDIFEEEKIDIFEEEKIDTFEEEKKIDIFEEEKIDTFEEEKIDTFEEEKIEIIEEEKRMDIYEEESIINEEEKIVEIEEEKKEYFREKEKELKIEEEIELEKENIKEEKEKIIEEVQEEILEEEEENEIKTCEQLEKCELCNEESVNLNLCIKCNNLKGYYYLNINSIPKEELEDEFIDCVNNETKPSKFYFNEENEDYRVCHETCATCDEGGNWDIHNCKTCQTNYIFKPDINTTTNCVIKCPFYYYYTTNGQYKCTEDYYCPLNYILFIDEKGKCTNDCKRDDTYKYQYDNRCLKECPDNTSKDNYICKDKFPENPFNTVTNHTFFSRNISDEEMARLVQLYKDNFYYTNNHISTYTSGNYTITIYKNSESITNLSLGIPKVNFENCYTKIKNQYGINDDLIIALESEKIEKENDKIISFSVYDPRNGNKIIFNDLCINDSVIVQEELEDKVENLDSIINLLNQGIDVLNPNSDFYTDLCFHFKSPIDGKEIPLKERFKLFFPNVSLCEKGCSTKGINTTTYTSICECTLNNLINNDILGENIFFQSAMAEVKTLFQETNIEVLRCYKDLFHLEFYTSNYGSFIILALFLIQIILTIIYYKKFIFSMRKYLYNLMQNFLLYLSTKNIPTPNKLDNSLAPIQNKLITFKSNPIKKSSKNVGKKNVESKIENKNSNIHMRNKNRINNNNINNENQKLSFDELIKHKKQSCDYSGKQSTNRKFTPNSKFSKERNSLMLENVTKINVEEYIKTDPDDMDYDNAIGRDKRTFCVYFCDNIKTDLLILNMFCNYEQLNPWPIKFLLFILNVDLYFFVNGLFFTEDYLSEMLYDKNVNFFDFASRFIDRLYYITLIGIIISYIMNCFFFEERIIKKTFKREKNNEIILKYEMSQFIKNIKSRYNSFIIICFFAAIIIWYYAFCFNNIYPSMKKEWIITSVIIIFAMQFVYFLKLLVETIIRFIAIKCKSERLFKISQFLS